MKIALVGDLFISRPITSVEMGALAPIREILSSCDCSFGNLETAILRVNEAPPSMFPGGGYAMADPACLCGLRELGFNLFSAANNHSMDYGEKGILKTCENLRSLGLPFAGIGRDLQEASAPAYCETMHGRVALISVTSSFHDSYAAGPKSKDMIGRPGVAPLRHWARYHVTNGDYEDLQRIADVTGINSYHNRARRQGYLPRSESLKFGAYDFVRDDQSYVETTPLEIDLSRTKNSVGEARQRAEVVVVSVHSHQFKGEDSCVPPDFITNFCREMIDAGADIVVCHGPHKCRGLEKYGRGIILHGLGDFILQHEQQKVLPAEIYLKYGLDPDRVSAPKELYDRRSKNGTVGLVAEDDAWWSVLVTVRCTAERFDVELYPVEISRKTGLPKIVECGAVLERLNQLSRSCCHPILFENGKTSIPRM